MIILFIMVFLKYFEESFCEVLFNIILIILGIGYVSVNYMIWGSSLIVMFFFIGLIGGCVGLIVCLIKIFCY